MPRTQPRTRAQTPDEFLRAAGFRIVSRPGKGEAVWERGGQLYRHSDAMELANDEHQAELWALEEKWGK